MIRPHRHSSSAAHLVIVVSRKAFPCTNFAKLVTSYTPESRPFGYDALDSVNSRFLTRTRKLDEGISCSIAYQLLFSSKVIIWTTSFLRSRDLTLARD